MQLLIGTSKSETLNAASAAEAYEIQALAGDDVAFGSAFADVLIGGLGADQLFGNAGDDVFRAQPGDTGADIVNGGDGFDTILGGAGDDILSYRSVASIERIDSGGGSDILRGSSHGNFWNFSLTELIGIAEIDLLAGNDQFTGAASNDRVIGGAGNDTLDGGGGGADTAVYVGTFGSYTITPLSGGQLRVDAGAGADGVDTVRNFEILEFADGIYANGVFTPFGNPGNTVPVANPDTYAGTEDQPLVVNANAGVLSNDSDLENDPLSVSSFSASSSAGGAVAMGTDGSFTYAPAANFNGTDTFTYVVSDGRGGFATGTVTVQVAGVGDPPVANNNAYTGTGDTALVVAQAAGVLANDTDADGNPLSVSGFDSTSAQGGSVTMNGNGSFTYTPSAGFTGTDTFSYTATDGTSFDAAVVTITVNPPGSGLALLMGTAASETLNVSAATQGYEVRALAGSDVVQGSGFGDLIVGGVGVDQLFGNGGDDVFLAELGDTNADIVDGGAGLDTILGGGGNDVLLYRNITSIERIDGGGGSDILRGTINANFWNFSLTTLVGIVEIDLLAGNDQFTGSAGNERVIGGAGNDILEGGAGTNTAVYAGNFASYTLTPLSGGQLRVDAGAGTDGVDTVRNFAILEFANGIYANGVFTPFGNPGNNPPTAQADSYADVEDSQLIVTVPASVLKNDTDPDGDALAVSSFDAHSAHGGTVAMNSNGSFNYMPVANFNGTDTFSYVASDGRGGSATASVTINVAAVNDAPNAVNNSYSASKGSPLVVNAASGVLTNDTDADGNTLSIITFDAASAQGGQVTMNPNGSFTYTPPAGFTGTDSFAYSATDGIAQDNALVSVLVSDSPPPTSAFGAIISALPENEWVKLNTNQFRDVWTPVDQRPYESIAGSPGSIILAWGSATWDSNRNEYIIWGGGHANYEGNEVYTWSAATLQWERASLPSAVELISGARYEAVDGYEHAPISSHAYDNLEFLEVADRMINFGGAAAHTGSGFVETDGATKTGPYLWDPSKADPNKVGGLTGSQVNPGLYPDIIGAEMWENRQTWTDISPIPGSMVQGTTDYALIDGLDVVFVNPYTQGLFKYTVHDVNDPSQDTWEQVGKVWDSYAGQGAGAYDPDRNIYVRTSTTEFTYWDLDTAGPSNRNVSFIPIDPTGEFALNTNWGMEYDQVRDRFVLWEGDASIWYLQPPDEPSASGWTLEKAPEPTQAAPAMPSVFRGVLGKWDYVQDYDIFVGVTNHLTGDVWAYKPEGWISRGRDPLGIVLIAVLVLYSLLSGIARLLPVITRRTNRAPKAPIAPPRYSDQLRHE